MGNHELGRLTDPTMIQLSARPAGPVEPTYLARIGYEGMCKDTPIRSPGLRWWAARGISDQSYSTDEDGIEKNNKRLEQVDGLVRRTYFNSKVSCILSTHRRQRQTKSSANFTIRCQAVASWLAQRDRKIANSSLKCCDTDGGRWDEGERWGWREEDESKGRQKFGVVVILSQAEFKLAE
ncbi:hypothetical protein B0H11DRAFT_1899925 [Mycena galericulata]|nr:hypothetical protein B0H11DRAFT_1899925 [Mycena galericulata]